MRILALSDVHQRTQNLKALLEKAGKGFDAVIVAGDLTNYGEKRHAEEVLGLLAGHENVFAVPGNLDTLQVIDAITGNKMQLHAKKAKIAGVAFVGFGGGKAFEVGEVLFTEEEIFGALEKLCKGEKNFVLVTHLPPLGTALDLTAGGKHIGSSAVRKIIEKFQPALQLCGHCHEAGGKTETIGKTLCVNVAAVKEGQATAIELPKIGLPKTERITI
ncbi:MAG: metallophosphoesterase family protein [Candidatus Diapherotrites archaeon]|nr:metallophosphoesterase family protein [Candidatus Diapherotrites archaeon]